MWLTKAFRPGQGPRRSLDLGGTDGLEPLVDMYYACASLMQKILPDGRRYFVDGDIDDLPADINFDLSQSASFSQPTPQSSQQLNAESISGEPALKKPRN